MNTDKIYAEQLANEYALKDTSKVIIQEKATLAECTENSKFLSIHVTTIIIDMFFQRFRSEFLRTEYLPV